MDQIFQRKELLIPVILGFRHFKAKPATEEDIRRQEERRKVDVLALFSLYLKEHLHGDGHGNTDY